MNSPLRRALKQADICREQGCIGWHDLRHTYASHLAMRGVPLTVIRELMGHGRVPLPSTSREPKQPHRWSLLTRSWCAPRRFNGPGGQVRTTSRLVACTTPENELPAAVALAWPELLRLLHPGPQS